MAENGHNGHDAPPGGENIFVAPGLALMEMTDLVKLNKRLDELFEAIEKNKDSHLKLRRSNRGTLILISVYFIFVMLVLLGDFYTNWWHH